jgi:hypothetical protein
MMRPQPNICNASKGKDFCQENKAVSHHFPTEMSRIDTGLSAVVAAWYRLPTAIREGIVAMVKAAPS